MRLNGKRGRKIFLCAAGVIFLLAIAAARAVSGLVARFDDPARLGAPVHVLMTNGFTIRWVEKPAATGRAALDLVFIHGTPGGAGVWASQFQIPLANANLFAYNRPGFGGSQPVRGQPHLQLQVDALMTLLAGITTNRVLLVGHSYGSPIALLAGLEHPERIGGMLLIGGDVDPAEEKPWWVQYIFGWRATSWCMPRALRQCNRELLTVRADLTELRKRLPQLSVPVVMLHGDRDPLVPVENVAWLEQQLAALHKSSLFAKIILPGANHFIPWEHPDAVERGIHLLDEMAARRPARHSTNHFGFPAGRLAAESDQEADMLIASGDGALACDVACVLRHSPSPRNVFTLGFPGSTAASVNHRSQQLDQRMRIHEWLLFRQFRPAIPAPKPNQPRLWPVPPAKKSL